MKKVLLGMLVVMMLLVACGGDATEAPSPVPLPSAAVAEPSEAPAVVPTEAPVEEVERTTIRFAVTDWELPIYEDLIAAFEEENPDLHIEVVSVNEVLELGPLGNLDVPDDADQRLVAAADVVSIGVSRQTVRDGLLRDLTPSMEADSSFQPDDFHPGVLESFQWEGGTWALPNTLSFRLFFYDKDALDEAGVPYPEPDWTWDDMLSAAKTLTVRDGDDVARWGFVPVDQAYRLIESRFGSLVDDSADPRVPRYDDEEVIEATRWYTDLYLKEQVMPYFEPEEEQDEPLMSDAEALVDQGKAAMWPETDIIFWLRSQQGNVGVAPFPADTPGDPVTPASASGFSMSAGTAQPQAAWRWIEYLSRQPVSLLGTSMRFLPARRSTAETGGFWDGLDEGLEATLRYTLDHNYMMAEPVGYDSFTGALDAIFTGEKSPEQAMVDAQSEAEAAIQEAEAERAGATPAPTFAVAPPEGEPEPAEGAVTITYVPGIGSLNLEPYRDLADRFQEEHPGIVVEVKMADFLSGAPSLKDMAENSDCFQWFPGFENPENREAILSLKPFIDADPSFNMDDYYSQVLGLYTWQGQLMGLPADITPFVFQYNKDLFDAAGQDYPEAGWTWDDFMEIAVAMTEGEGETKQYGYAGEIYELNDLLMITERLGAKLLDPNAEPTAFSFDDPDTVEAMRWYASLTTEHDAKPPFVTDITKIMGASTSYLEREGMIGGGRVAMWPDAPGVSAVLGDRSELNIGHVALPARVDGDTSGSYVTASGSFISASTDKRQECWDWITFLSGEPAAAQGLPARQSVANSDAYRQQVGAERAEAYLSSLGESDRPTTFQLFSEEEWLGGAIYWYGQAYGQVIAGEASAEDALHAAQKLADDYRACVIAAGDFSEETWQACAQEVDPSLPAFLFGGGF